MRGTGQSAATGGPLWASSLSAGQHRGRQGPSLCPGRLLCKRGARCTGIRAAGIRAVGIRAAGIRAAGIHGRLLSRRPGIRTAGIRAAGGRLPASSAVCTLVGQGGQGQHVGRHEGRPTHVARVGPARAAGRPGSSLAPVARGEAASFPPGHQGRVGHFLQSGHTRLMWGGRGLVRGVFMLFLFPFQNPI